MIDTLAKAFDFARQVSRTPNVVNDSGGFFTSRVISTFLNEAVAMLAEGIPPASIEQAGLQAGYPAAPLQLCDELKQAIMQRSMSAAVMAAPPTPEDTEHVTRRAHAVITRMLELDRAGKAGRVGFCNYAEGDRAGCGPGWVSSRRQAARPSRSRI